MVSMEIIITKKTESNYPSTSGFLKVLPILAVLGVLLILLAHTGESRIITVDDDGNEDHSSIQDAINDSVVGDSILVFDGDYHEIIVIDKRISLIGNGSVTTTIIGNNSAAVVSIMADGCNISGFHIQGRDSTTISDEGGNDLKYPGIHVLGNNTKVFENTCSENKEGISISDSLIYIPTGYYCSVNLIASNICYNNTWCGIEGIKIETTRIENNTLFNSENGIDIQNINQSAVFIEIRNNHCYNMSTGISVSGGIITLVSENICENSLTGISIASSDNNTLIGNKCTNNTIGIHLSISSYNVVENSVCTGNENGLVSDLSDYNFYCKNIFDFNGEGMFLSDSSFNQFENNSFTKNTATGLWFHYGVGNRIENNTFLNNTYGMNLASHCENYTIINNTLSNNNKDDSYTYGIYIHGGIGTHLEMNTIIYNSVGIYFSSKGSLDYRLVNNKIANNTHAGINATYHVFISVNATHNDWGDESGPYHPTKNPDGMGDAVTDNIEFDPWLGKQEKKEEESEEDNEELEIIPLLIIGGILSISSLGYALSKETIRISILSAGAVLLYSKLGKDDILAQSNRSDIYTFIVTNPGVNYSHLRNSLPIGSGTLLHHLAILEREGWVRSKKKSGRRIYYPGRNGGNKIFNEPPVPPSPHQEHIMCQLRFLP